MHVAIKEQIQDIYTEIKSIVSERKKLSLRAVCGQHNSLELLDIMARIRKLNRREEALNKQIIQIIWREKNRTRR